VSVHFTPEDVAAQIATLRQINAAGEDIDYVRDFTRPTQEQLNNLGVYPTGDLKWLEERHFRPRLTEVALGEGKDIGYVADLTVGGKATVNREDTYYVGFMAFLMLVAPAVLADQSDKLQSQIDLLRNNVKQIMKGEEVKFLPRQNRMATSTLLLLRPASNRQHSDYLYCERQMLECCRLLFGP
jgi:hypothetical protein